MNCLEILFSPFLQAYSTNLADIGGLLRHPASGNLGRALRVTEASTILNMGQILQTGAQAFDDLILAACNRMLELSSCGLRVSHVSDRVEGEINFYFWVLSQQSNILASSDKPKECLGQNEVEL
ncbi:hypothetical protein C8R43DRAFT_949219 [Mycena crocata]|nr:hypothetical protein C8R43DRAFT_949219 [Mycena crocata]